jgi:hypothetical protein
LDLIRHGNQRALPTHRLLLNTANAQKVPVSWFSLETADDALIFGVEPKQVALVIDTDRC